MKTLIKKLSGIHFGEMGPYYIMRYGFYEGHSEYRADPIAISFIFGLRSLEEIEQFFTGNLYNSLTGHFTRKTVKVKSIPDEHQRSDFDLKRGYSIFDDTMADMTCPENEKAARKYCRAMAQAIINAR